MNGAAMDCRQEQVLCTQHRDTSGLHSPGYHLQINHPPRQQNSQQYSKAMNYQSDHFLVDRSSESLQHKDKYSFNSRHKTAGVEVRESRPQTSKIRTREPLELPVPKFEIDENYVGELPTSKDSCSLLQNSKELDLDTRIDLLIKSKALAGMHPIFSELDQSDESSYDSDDSFRNDPKSKHRLRKKHKTSPAEKEILSHESFDDPEIPLSRPPSPYLSRATYLFWFNKAIELKEQAKAQEQALLEKAAKKLIQDGGSAGKPSTIQSSTLREKPFLKSLINEISKELKEIVKQEFIREVVENTAFHTLEDWWEKQKELEGGIVNELSSLGGTTEIEQMELSVHDNLNNDYHGSTSPKMPFPWADVDLKQSSDDIDIHSEAKDSSTEIKLPPDDLKIVGKPVTENEYVSLKNNCYVTSSPYLREEGLVENSNCQKDSQYPERARHSTRKKTGEVNFSEAYSLHTPVTLTEEQNLNDRLAEESTNLSRLLNCNTPAEHSSNHVEEKTDKCSIESKKSVLSSLNHPMNLIDNNSLKIAEIQLLNRPFVLNRDSDEFESKVTSKSERIDCNNPEETEIQLQNKSSTLRAETFECESEVVRDSETDGYNNPDKTEVLQLNQPSVHTAYVSEFESEVVSKSDQTDDNNSIETGLKFFKGPSTLTADKSKFELEVTNESEQDDNYTPGKTEILQPDKPFNLTADTSKFEEDAISKSENMDHKYSGKTEIELLKLPCTLATELDFESKPISGSGQIDHNKIADAGVEFLNQPFTLGKDGPKCENKVIYESEHNTHNSVQTTEIQLPYQTSTQSPDNSEIGNEIGIKSEQHRIDLSEIPDNAENSSLRCVENLAFEAQETSAVLVQKAELSSKECDHDEKNIPVELKEEVMKESDLLKTIHGDNLPVAQAP